ncbi:hypothetical protein K7X08_000024 [Anisodus acutangulus]|uniref:Uncharacterized protein n=1 Tax=Anisodus acutangulus TaxID=402998 RepID=A0A9Q1M9Y2_9SOLA|nr:hypothetical protein K7X08_000024 [Anisodus acutangulus]
MLQRGAQTVQNVPASAPQASQDSEFVFMPNPSFNVCSSQQTSQQSSQPISEAAGPSKSKRKVNDKPDAPSMRSTKNNVAPSTAINQPVAPSRVVVTEDDDEGELDDEDEPTNSKA